MANTRERINRIKLEKFRATVPIDPTETIYQGDQVCWDVANRRATKLVATSGASFLGISDTSSPIETIGSHFLLTDPAFSRINVVQKGLVEQIVDIADNGSTYYPFDALEGVTDAQTVKLGSTLKVGFVDPRWATPTGKVVATGDLVRLWLVVPAAYRFTD